MRFFADFFQNHGFLNIRNQPQWLVLKNGSRQYIDPLTRNYRGRIRLNYPVKSIRRTKDAVAVTYNMNRLQSLRSNTVFCVSLNLSELISPDRVIAEYRYAHPVYTPESTATRRRYDEINGENRTFYCGAYWYNGFHEDGVKSALTVARHFGKKL